MKKYLAINFNQKAILGFVLLLIAVAGQNALANQTAKGNKDKDQVEQVVVASIDEEMQKRLEQDWGIRVVALRSTMSGLMVDFRYKIIDAKKASPLLDLNTKAYLVVEKNKARLGVPHAKKVGALRQTTHPKKVKEGIDYYILFGNPGARYIKPGDKATLVIGDLKVEHLTLL